MCVSYSKVLSKGRIVWQVRRPTQGANLTEFNFRLTQAMTPGARIVTFALIGDKVGSEVISDSLWVDVQGRCEEEVSSIYRN